MSAPNINSDDYYEVLGVSKNVSEKDIRRAYRKLARQHHPDQNPDDKEAAEERFKAIGEAYGVLSDPKKRKQYDQFGKQGLQNNGMGGGFSNIDAHEIFRMFMGGNSGGPGGFRMGGMGGSMGGGFPFGDLFGSMGHGHGMNFSHGGMHQPRRQQRKVRSPLPRGTKVYLHSLSSGNFNGRIGRIQSYTGERFSVDIEGVGLKNIRPQNLCQSVECEVHSLNYEALNGSIVKTMGYSPNFERIKCQFSDGQIKMIKAINIEIPAGTIIRIDGLQNAAAASLNGKYARVLEWLPEKGRYSVEIVDSSKSYKMKPENARL